MPSTCNRSALSSIGTIPLAAISGKSWLNPAISDDLRREFMESARDSDRIEPVDFLVFCYDILCPKTLCENEICKRLIHTVLRFLQAIGNWIGVAPG